MGDWLNESAQFLSGERHCLHLLSASLWECICQDVKASLSGCRTYVWLSMCLPCLSVWRLCHHMLFLCVCAQCMHMLLCACSCIDMVHCSLCANGYWHIVMCICLSVYPCVFFKCIYETSEGECLWTMHWGIVNLYKWVNATLMPCLSCIDFQDINGGTTLIKNSHKVRIKRSWRRPTVLQTCFMMTGNLMDAV